MERLYSWGANNCGQLGSNSVEDRLMPGEVQEHNLHVSQIVCVGGGGATSFLLKASGELSTCGNSDKGQQGRDNKDNILIFSPLPVSPSVTITKVSAGWDFFVAITESGGVLSWGSNAFGQLGRHIPEGRKFDPKPTPVSFPTDGVQAVDVQAGLRHVVIITDSKEVWTWGHGKKGQLGQVDADGEAKIKSYTPGKVVLETRDPVRQVVAGMSHSGAITVKGQIFMWGCNKYGQCGVDTGMTALMKTPYPLTLRGVQGETVISLVSGWTHVTARTDAGHLYSWGRSDLGQLGRCCKDKWDEVPGPVELTSVVDHCSGSEHNLAVNSNGELYSWGWNEHGICGTGGEDNVYRPHRVNTFTDHTVMSVGCGAGHSFCLTQMTTQTTKR